MTPSHPLEPCVTRRQFGALAAGGVGAPGARGWRPCPCRARSSCPPARHRYAPAPTRRSRSPPCRAARRPEATAAAVRRAAVAATDFAWLGRGDAVLIKPVCNSGNAYPATTDPLALHAMIALLRESGAGRVIVADMSGVQFVRFGPDRHEEHAAS